MALDLCKEVRGDAYRRAIAKAQIWNEGASGLHYVAVRYKNLEFQSDPHEVMLNGRMARVSNFSCDVIFRVRQEAVNIDRGANLDFALVVEDCLTRDRHAASKRTGLTNIEMTNLSTPVTNPSERPIENGSIMAILTDKWLDYASLRAAKLAQDPKTELLPAS